MNASPAPVVSTTLTLNGGIWPVLVLVASKAPSEPIVTATVFEPRFEEFLGNFLVVGFAGEFMGMGASGTCEASVWKVLRGSDVTGKSSADLSRRELAADAGEQVDRAIAIGIDWNPAKGGLFAGYYLDAGEVEAVFSKGFGDEAPGFIISD